MTAGFPAVIFCSGNVIASRCAYCIRVMNMDNSIWTKDVERPSFPILEGDLKTDVLVVGGGLAGLLCAYKLSEAGVDCALIEAGRIMGGVSCGTTAKITAQHGLIYRDLLRRFGEETAKGYWEANQAAIADYRRLAAAIPCDLENEDNVLYATDAASDLEAEKAALDRLGIPAELTDRTGLPFPVAGALRFRDQARFHPLKFAFGLSRGLRIYENTRALEFAPGRVRTDRGTIQAQRVIVATHFPILNKHGAYFLKMYQDRSYMLALEGAEPMDAMYLDASGKGLSFRNQGKYLLVGGGSHRTGKTGTGWEGPERFAYDYAPGAEVVARWAAQDCITLDGMPYIGRYSPSVPELYVATGFHKWGMTTSMVAADILTSLVQGREHPYAGLFDPARSIWHPQLAVNALESAWNLLRPTGPRCPHLGCALRWNRFERSWDCPCHGSRFSADGKLLDDPATGDLKKRKR